MLFDFACAMGRVCDTWDSGNRAGGRVSDGNGWLFVKFRASESCPINHLIGDPLIERTYVSGVSWIPQLGTKLDEEPSPIQPVSSQYSIQLYQKSS